MRALNFPAIVALLFLACPILSLNTSHDANDAALLERDSVPSTSVRKELAARIAPVPPGKTIDRAVFAHYMVGNVDATHAHQDIDSAAAIGLKGFALNIGDPSQPFVRQTLDAIFDYTRDNHPTVKHFISMDTWATKAGGNSLEVFKDILSVFKGHSAYYQGPNGYGLVSTFSDGGFHNDQWDAFWNNDFAGEVYFLPNFDNTAGYWTGDPGWYAYWNNTIHGMFSWDSCWPDRYSTDAGSIARDQVVISVAHKNYKTYMVGLSPLQYKNSYDTNYYREGELNLPQRMKNILEMDPKADITQIISWNDGPESHYIGNLWLEQNNDTQPYLYANQIEWSHLGWQPLITSFIDAFKLGLPASGMLPEAGKQAVGALWYKTILSSSVCPSSTSNLYSNPGILKHQDKPDGMASASDNLNWAVVLPSDGMVIRVVSNGKEIDRVIGKKGLNFGASPNVQPGPQRLELWDAGSTHILLAASGGRCVSAGCPDCIYNMNYQVAELRADTAGEGKCPYRVCKKQVFAHYMVGTVLTEHAQQDIKDAANMGLDGFALNVADPREPFVVDAFNSMFDYARDNFPNFKLYFSLDLWALGNALGGKPVLSTYDPILTNFKGHDAYLKGPNGASFISTYSSGGLHNDDWIAFRNRWGNQLYFVPDFDDTAGYNTSDSGWWGYWGDIVDGMMSWETAWADPGLENTGSVAVDKVIVSGAANHLKSYMMPLSPLQYKNSYDANYYRQCDLGWIQRMENILNMPISPDYVEYLTWNDGPESHYIGNLWTEQNHDYQPSLYMNADADHKGWQPLLTSFIAAFKAGLPASSMAPPAGSLGVGAMWYKTILQSSVCPFPSANKYTAKPRGFEAGKDQLNWAIIMPQGSSGWSVRAIINGAVSAPVQLHGGLNYGHFPATAGQQRLEVLYGGSVQMAAAGGRCISADCPDCIYNMNPQVVPLLQDTGARMGKCPAQSCANPSDLPGGDLPGDGAAGLPNQVVVDPAIWDTPSPQVQCVPPCVLVLPPYPLGAEIPITLRDFATSVLSLSGDGYTYTVETILSVPTFHVTELPLWPVWIGPSDPTAAAITPVQSMMPPAQIMVLGPNEATMPPTPFPGFSWPVNYTAPPIVWVTVTQRVVIQPQASGSITSPPPVVPMVTYHVGTGTGTPTTTTSNDTSPHPTGHLDCRTFGCGSGCGEYGCDGGCGYFFCGGGCGLFGCGGFGGASFGGIGPFPNPIPVPPPGWKPPLGGVGSGVGGEEECTLTTVRKCTSTCLTSDGGSSCTKLCTLGAACDTQGATTGVVVTLPGWGYQTLEQWAMPTTFDAAAVASAILHTRSSRYGQNYPDESHSTSTTHAPLPTLSGTETGSGPGASCVSTSTWVNCVGSGNQAACETSSSCASFDQPTKTTALPSSTPSSVDPNPEPTHCVFINLESYSAVNTVWDALMYFDETRVCSGERTCRCDSSFIPCDAGYTLRWESSDQTEADGYINVFWTAPGLEEEIHWKLFKMPESSIEDCGLPPTGKCAHNYWRNQYAECPPYTGSCKCQGAEL